MSNFKAKISAELDTSKVEQQIDELNGKKIKVSIDTGNAAKDVKQVEKQIVNTKKTTQSFGDTLRKSFNIGSAATITSQAFNAIRTAANKAKEAIVGFDDSIVDLRMATGGSYADVSKLVTGYNQLGKAIGATTTEVSDGADAWLRQGNSIGATNTLIKNSMMLSKIAKLESAESTKFLTSSMKGYKIAVEDTIGIVDKLSAVDLVSATDAGGLAEAMSRTAETANLVGVSMDRLLGYLAATGEVTQKSMTSIGESFKTIFTRMSDIKAGKLELIDEDGTVESLSDVETVLNSVGIKLRESNNEFRNFGDVLDDVASAWSSYSSVQQAAITKAFAGTRQSENFKVLMENYASATSYMETAMNSAGTAEQKFGAYLDSIEAKTKSLQASFESLAVNTFSTELIGGIVEATTSLVTFLDRSNLLKSSLAGIAGAGVIKVFTMISAGITNAVARMNEFNTALNLLKAGNIGESQLQKLIQLTSSLSDSQLKAVLSSKALSNQQRIAILTANGMSTSEAQATLTTMGLATAEGTAATVTSSLSGALKGLWATLKANPLILVAGAITTAVTAFNAFSQAAEEEEQRAEENFNKLTEAAQAATETRSSVSSLIEQYQKLADAMDGTWSAEEAAELKDIQEQITSLVGNQANNLDLVNGKIEEEYQKLLSIRNLLLDDELSAAESNYIVAQEKLEEGYIAPKKEESHLADWYIRRAYEEINGVETTGDNGSNVWWGKEVFGDSYDGNGWLGDIPTALEQIGSYEEGLDKLEEWRDLLLSTENLDFFGDDFGEAYEIGDALSYLDSKIEEFKGVISEAQEAKDRFFSAKANNEALDYLVENDINTQEDFNDWINSVVNNSEYSKDYAKALISAMQMYLPTFDIPDEVKRDLIATRDEVISSVANAMYDGGLSGIRRPDVFEQSLGSWLDELNNSEYELFVNWLAENADSEVVMGSIESMTAAFENYLKRIDIATNGISNAISKIDIAAETSGIESVTSAIEESLSSTGLTEASIASLTQRYKDLAEFDAGALFEKTALGIHLNTQELNKLESAYKKQKFDETTKSLKFLNKQYIELGKKIDEADPSERDSLIKQRDQIEDEIDSVSRLAAAYSGLTSAYNKWLNAKEAGNKRDTYANVKVEKTDIDNRIKNGWIDDTVRNYVDMLSSADLSEATDEAILLAWQDVLNGDIGGFNLFDFFTVDADDNATKTGLLNFVDALTTVSKELGESWITIGENGEKIIDFGFETDDSVAKKLGMDVEALHILLTALDELAGWDTHIDSDSYTEFGTIEEKAKEAAAGIEELTGGEISIDFEVNDEEKIRAQIQSLIDYLNKDDNRVKLGVDGVEEIEYAINHLFSLLKGLEEDPPILQVDQSKVGEDTSALLQKIGELRDASQKLELAQWTGNQEDIDTYTKKVNDLATEVIDLHKAANESEGIDLGIRPGQDAAFLLELLQNKTEATLEVNLKINKPATTTPGTTNSDPVTDTETSPEVEMQPVISVEAIQAEIDKADYHVDINPIPNTNALQNAISSKTYSAGVRLNLSGPSTFTIYPNFASGTVQIQGPANAQGTAFAHGDISLHHNGEALGGELGAEMVVRNGKFFTIGEDSAEFFKYQKGDIIFNAEQTRQIFKNGKITNGAKRGVAYAQGNAFTGGKGNDLSDLIDSIYGNTSGKTSSGKTSKDDDSEKFDWIEVALSRIERAIDKLKNVASSAYKAIEKTVGATRDAISGSTKELEVQQKAYDRYMKEANSVGLSSDLAKLVQDGSIDITEYDKETQEKIQEYQEWYEKALEADDAISDIHEDIASLYEDIFNMIDDNLGNQLDLIGHSNNRYDTGNDMLEAGGYLDSTALHSASIESNYRQLEVLNKGLADLEQAFSDGINSGEIEEGSEAWYSMSIAINDTKEEIDDLNLSIAETEKTIREIEWEHFDYIQGRIARITDEAGFLIDLMSNADLHTDNGQLTEEGLATMGLRGLNYNTYMAQADQYGKELLEINKQLAEDPYNTDLIARKEELLDLQQDSILAAEAEKQAIVDLVEEGINLELEALQDLIDKYTDALDSAKDLYDYQNKIADQTSEISSLRKQLWAYEGDDSEEAKATIQKLQTDLAKAEKDLEETEYDQYISDQKKLLDDLYAEYEEILNQGLDNVGALIEDTISTINTNTDSINETLTQVSNDIGYEMTEAMQTIWNGSTDSIEGTMAVYGDGFSDKLTSINSVLSSINAHVASLISKSDILAGEVVDSTETTTPPKVNIEQPPAEEPEKQPEAVAPPAEPAKTIEVGGKIDATGAKIYGGPNDKRGSSQYYSFDPIYKVLREVDGYLEVRHHKLKSGITGWFKKEDVKAYKTGGLVDYTGLAQLDGTPSKPELVLNSNDTENFLALKETLHRLSQQKLTLQSTANVYGDVSPIAHVGLFNSTQAMKRILSQNATSNIQQLMGDINITIPIEHVQDYNDFVNQLRNDGKFEKMIQSITIDRIVGGSALAKGKYKW